MNINITINEYHNEEPYKNYTGASLVKAAEKSLKVYKQKKSEEGSGKKIFFDFGNAFEAALLDEKSYLENVVIFNEADRPEPDKTFGSKLNKAWKEEFMDTDKLVINLHGDHSVNSINQMLLSVKSNKFIYDLISECSFQDTYIWEDAKSGLTLKARPDLASETKSTIIDVKTIEDASPREVSRAVNRLGYPVQALQQIEGFENSYKKEVENYLWLFVEKKEPYDVVLYEFSKEDRELKKVTYLETLVKIANAEKTGNFEGYSAGADNELGILTAKIY